jgi:hypothetical protein
LQRAIKDQTIVACDQANFETIFEALAEPAQFESAE